MTEPTIRANGNGSRPDHVDLRQVAVRRLRRKRVFRFHLFVYLTINTLFWAGWVRGGLADQWVFPWPIFPTVFWGLFVVGRRRDLYGTTSISEKHIEREIEQLRHASNEELADLVDLRDRPFSDLSQRPFDGSHRRR